MQNAKILVFVNGKEGHFLRAWGMQLVSAFRTLKIDTIVADVDNQMELRNVLEEALNAPLLCAVGIGGVGLNLYSSSDMLLMERLNVPFVAVLVDHSFNPNCSILNTPYSKLIITSIEMSDAAYAVKRFKHAKLASFLPLGADIATSEFIPYEERKIPILFCGTLYSYFERQWKHLSKPIRSILDDACDLVLSDDNVSIPDGITEVIRNRGIYTDELLYTGKMQQLMNLLNMYIRTYKRNVFLEELVKGGLMVDVYGGPAADSGAMTWAQWKYSDRIRWHGPVSYLETVELSANSKIVLNCGMFPQGIHDRVFCGMINQALLVTDGGSVFSQNFVDGIDAIAYSWKNLSEVPEKIAHLLAHPQEAKVIIQNGYVKTLKEHTWEKRAERILECTMLI